MPTLMPGWEDTIKQALAEQQAQMPQVPPPAPALPAPMAAPQAAAPAQVPDEAKPGLLSQIVTGGLAGLFLQNPMQAIEHLKQNKIKTYQAGQEAAHTSAQEAAKTKSAQAGAGMAESALGTEQNQTSPTSNVSVLARKEASSLLNAPIPESATFKDINAIMPQIGMLLEKKYAAELKAAAMGQKAGEAKAAAGAKEVSKADENVTRTIEELNGLKGSQNQAAIQLRKLQTAAEVKNELAAIATGKIVADPVEQTRLATQLASLEISGSRIPYELVKHMQNKTGAEGFGKLMTYLTSEPNSVLRAKSLEQMNAMLDTSQKTWQGKATDTIRSAYKMHKNDFAKSPDASQRFIDSIQQIHSYLTPEDITGEAGKVNMTGPPPEVPNAMEHKITTSTGFKLKVR